MEKTKKPMSEKTKLVVLYILSFLMSSAPLLITLFCRWGDYTKTPEATTKLCFGGIIVVFFIVLKVIGKLKMPAPIVTFATVFVLSYLLESIIKDLQLLSLMALVGEAGDYIFFHFPIKNAKERIRIGKQTESNRVMLEQVLSKHEGRGG